MPRSTTTIDPKWANLTAKEKSALISEALREDADAIACRQRMSETELIAWHAMRSKQSENLINPANLERQK